MHQIEDVVERGMCVGCGACAIASGGKISVSIGRYGAFEANLNDVSEAFVRRGGRVCPMSDESRNETEIADAVFPPEMPRSDVLGTYQGVYAGRLSSDEILEGSSSGGLTSWAARQLLAKGLIDGVIHVGASGSASDGMFSYQVSYSQEALLAKRKSAYYSTSFAEALESIRGDGRKYAFIGVPCFVRAARLICESDPDLSNQLSFFLGLVCGHLKSAAFAASLAWQTGVGPSELESVDFRVKAPDRSSKDYDFGAKARGAQELLTKPTQSLVGGNWGHGMFQLNACNFCDDIFAETADVAFGDAWLPEYEQEPRGTNIVVTRNVIIDSLIQDADRAGTVVLDAIPVARAVASQGGNLRHRRLGLAVRLHDDIENGLSVPRKRVEPSVAGIPKRRLNIIRVRRAMSDESHVAFHEAVDRQDLQYFLGRMGPWLKRYRLADQGYPPRRMAKKLLRAARKLRSRYLP